MTASDLTWAATDGAFKCRVSAIVRHGHEILVCEVDGFDFTFLPGGKVRMGETSRAAVTRELIEELGRDIPVGDPVLLLENLYRDGDDRHELSVVFDAAWPAGIPADAVNEFAEDGHRFTWIDPRGLTRSEFRPPGLIPYLPPPPQPGIQHVVLDRWVREVAADA